MRVLKTYLLVLLMLSGMSSAFSQTQYRNSLTLKSALYNFFDNTPMFQESQYFGSGIANGYGIEYIRNVKNSHFWSVSLNTFYYMNFTASSKMQAGDNWLRSFLNLEGKYLNQFWKKNKHELFWETGLSMRVGDESNFLSYYPFAWNNFGETTFLHKTLFDLGIIGGIKYKYHLGNRFNVNIGLTGTVYPITYDKKIPAYGDDDKGPNWKMAFLSLGVGFDFGK